MTNRKSTAFNHEIRKNVSVPSCIEQKNAPGTFVWRQETRKPARLLHYFTSGKRRPQCRIIQFARGDGHLMLNIGPLANF